MSVVQDIQSLSPSAIIELFVLDLTAKGAGVLRFHAGTNALSTDVVWQGSTYAPMPIEAEGFELTSKGILPRPKMRVANGNGVMSGLVAQYGDLVGCKVTRKRTFQKYLDAINFPGGVNPSADANQFLPDEVWFVDRKSGETRNAIEWELSSAFDLMGVRLPYRQMIQNSCAWRYRGSECGYTGPDYDKNNQPCAPSQDFCTKQLSACKVRFGAGVIPFGGFPGSVRYG